MQKDAEPKPFKVKGYLYVMIEKISLPQIEAEVSCSLMIGPNSNCETKAYASESPINEVFLIEVPEEETTRLVAEFKEGVNVVGQCRFDVNPFFAYSGATNSMCSEINNVKQEKQGTVNIKITYFTAQFGKLKIRVFHLSMVEPIVSHYKKAKLKLKIGIYAQSSLLWDMKEEFDQTLELLVLLKNGNLEFDIVHDDGVLGKYTIYDLEKSNLLLDSTKAYQVSLFNRDKAVGTIKYQIDWLH